MGVGGGGRGDGRVKEGKKRTSQITDMDIITGII